MIAVSTAKGQVCRRVYYQNTNKVSTSRLKWTLYNSVVVTPDDGKIYYYSYGFSANEILISYGKDNSGKTGNGGTVVLPTNEEKSLYMPIYDSFQKFKGTVYIYHNPTAKGFQLNVFSNETDKVRFIIYYR